MSKKPAAAAPKMHVKVLSPAQVYYEGAAETVSAINKVGPFDILANHANFFSLLTTGDIVVDTGTQKLHFPIKHGIVKATSNIITIFIYLPDE
jgi:F0F1-type ATP synthase epsilon subunit